MTNVVDYSGNEKATYFYEAFGNARYSAEFTSNVWKYTGEQRDRDSGFYYLRARYYDPFLGRFLGRDPAEAGHPYAYAENNPVNFSDPSGLCIPEFNCPPGLGGGIYPPRLAKSKEGGDMKWCRIGWDCSVPRPALEGSWYWAQYQCTEGGCLGVVCYDIPAVPGMFSETRRCEEVSRPDRNLVGQLEDFWDFGMDVYHSCPAGAVRAAGALIGGFAAIIAIANGTDPTIAQQQLNKAYIDLDTAASQCFPRN